jgi:hypothetical protein
LDFVVDDAIFKQRKIFQQNYFGSRGGENDRQD